MADRLTCVLSISVSRDGNTFSKETLLTLAITLVCCELTLVMASTIPDSTASLVSATMLKFEGIFSGEEARVNKSSTVVETFISLLTRLVFKGIAVTISVTGICLALAVA